MSICWHRAVIELFSTGFGKFSKYKSSFGRDFFVNLSPVWLFTQAERSEARVESNWAKIDKKIPPETRLYLENFQKPVKNMRLKLDANM